MIGAEAIREMLKGLNLEKIAENLKVEIVEFEERAQAQAPCQAAEDH